MHRNWQVCRTNPEFLKYLSNRSSISRIMAQVLVNRGIKDVDSIRSFLSPSLEELHDPFALPDMNEAVGRLLAAAEKKEKVLVHGDYDADGITSTALLVSFFRKMGLETFYHIPNRITEGYGLSLKGIGKAKACGAGLIVTVDCGISSVKEVGTANSMGIDVIVTDHHEPPEQLPDAVAVINPHRNDSSYPFRKLAGVGVAFKLAQALKGACGSENMMKEGQCAEDLLDLVVLGTIADSVPLKGENRVLAAYGLQTMNRGPCRPGIEALKESAGLNGELRSGTLSFTLIPRINAAGRLDDAGEVVELFLTGEKTVAQRLAGVLDEQNRKRQKVQNDVFRSARGMIDPDKLDPVIVLAHEGWHPGVIGIVASRLVELFYRPVFLFSIDGTVAKGSARSIPGFHLYKAIARCSGGLIGFGGHSQAAGLKILTDKIGDFRDKINRIAVESLDMDELKPVLEIDAAVDFSDINFSLINELSLLEPFGESNREPLFGAKEIKVVNHKIVGTNHLKMLLKQNNVNVDTIGFSMGEKFEKIGGYSNMDIAFVPSINEWNGSRSLQLNLKAIRPSVQEC